MRKLILAVMLCCSFGVGNVMSYYTVSDCERAKEQCSYYESECSQGNLGAWGRSFGEGFMAVQGDLDEAINRPDYDLWNAHEQKTQARLCRKRENM